MTKYLLASVAALLVAVGAFAQGGGPNRGTCLHGSGETADHAARRDKAIKVAQAINSAQVVAVPQPRIQRPNAPKYRRPGELSNIPPLPRGFELQFNTDGESYNFAIKDTLDPCHFAIFSDQDKFVYTGTPITGARIVPITSQQ
jgi:hypothetical protein